jgi:hypothetical protein
MCTCSMHSPKEKKSKEKKYYISLHGGYCGIESIAGTPRQVKEYIERMHGVYNVREYHLATEEELAWVGAMGGRV